MRVQDLLEGKRVKGLDYEEVPVKTKKGEPPSKVIDKVILKLEGSSSGSFTVLAKNYKELQSEMKELTAKLDEKRSGLREKMEELFNDSDELSTRIVETCSLTLQLAKAVQPSTKTEVDYEKAFNSLVSDLEKMVPEMKEQVQVLLECAVKGATITKEVPGKASAFTIKEGVLDNVMAFFKKVHKKFMSWLGSYDKKLERAKAKLAAIQA